MMLRARRRSQGDIHKDVVSRGATELSPAWMRVVFDLWAMSQGGVLGCEPPRGIPGKPVPAAVPCSTQWRWIAIEHRAAAGSTGLSEQNNNGHATRKAWPDKRVGSIENRGLDPAAFERA